MLRIESKTLKVMSQPAHQVLLTVQKAISSALLGPASAVFSLLLPTLVLFFFLQLTEIVRTLSVQNLCSYTLMILIIPSLFVPLQEAVALRPLLHLSFSFQLFASGSSPNTILFPPSILAILPGKNRTHTLI